MSSSSLVSHLSELRRRIIVCLVAVGITAAVSYLFSDEILLFLTQPIRSQTGELFFFSPQGAFIIKIKTALFGGTVMASPVLFSQFWLFLVPALYPREKKAVFPLIVVTTCLFLTGTVFAFFAVMPVVMRFLLGFQTEFLSPMISIGHYLGFLVMISLAFGIAFNLPVFVLALVASRLVRVAQLKTYRRHAVVVIFVVASIITPPDMVSQFLLAIPLILLYEISILCGRFFEKRVSQSSLAS